MEGNSVYKLLTPIVVLVASISSADAALILGSLSFDAKDGSTLTSPVTQTVSAIAGNREFDFTFEVAITTSSGTLVESTANPVGGLAVASGVGSDNHFSPGEDLTFSLSITGVDGSDTWAPLLHTLSFSYVNFVLASDASDEGDIQTPTFQQWTELDAGPQFTGHITPSNSQAFGGSASSPAGVGTLGFSSGTGTGTVTSGTTTTVTTGIDVQETNGGFPVTSFTIRNPSTAIGNYLVRGIGFEVQANPEPSSLALGALAFGLCVTPYGRRRIKQLVMKSKS